MSGGPAPAPRAARRAVGGYAPEEPAAVAFVKRAIVAVVVVQLAVSLVSGYRAYFQVWRLDLRAPGRTLAAGSTLVAPVVSSGRVPVHLRLELVQGARSETLAERRVAASRLSFYDPRPRFDTLRVVLSPDVLARFDAGPAVARVTARGTMQFLREPPPEVRELAVELRPPAPDGRVR